MKNFYVSKTLLLLATLFISLFSTYNTYADIPQDGLLGEVKFDATNVYNTNMPSSNFAGGKSNKDASSPNGYVRMAASGDYYGYSGFTNVKTVSFWYNYYATTGEIFNNSTLILKTTSSNQVQVWYAGEQIGLMTLSGWNLITMYIDTTNGKLKIFVNGNQTSYSFSINRINILESQTTNSINTYLSSIRIYNKVLNTTELNDIYNEKFNTLKPVLTQGTGSITYATSTPSLDMTLGALTDTNTGSVNIYYSINSGAFLPYSGTGYSAPNNQAINLSFPADTFYYGPNTLQIKAYDGYEYSNITTYTINKNFFLEPNISTSSLLGSFHFKGNTLSETGSIYLTGSIYNYGVSSSFPNRFVSTTSDTNSIYVMNSSSNIETVSFWYKAVDGELFNNNYIYLNYSTSVGFRLYKSGTYMFAIGPTNDTVNWHLVTLQLDKADDKLYVNIDGGKYVNSIAYYRDSLYLSSDGANGLKLKKGSFAFVKLYSSKLSDSDILGLYTFYKNTPPTISAPTSTFTLASTDATVTTPIMVTDDDINQTIQYYYSFDNISFNEISGVTTSTPVMTGAVNLVFSGSLFNTGVNTLYLKANDTKDNSNTLTLTVTKTLNNLNITIDESGLYQITNKNIKASVNLGNLFYAKTMDNVCDETLNFLPYQDLYFTNTSENGTRVCYKAVYGEEIQYKISSEVSGIGNNTIGVKDSNIFYNYTSWKKGEIKDFDPLYILITSQVSISTQGTNTTYNYPKLITDVNGDGLPDLLLTEKRSSTIFFAGYQNTLTEYLYGLLLNKGNMEYDMTYRCVRLNGPVNYPDNGLYGDCVK